jgi:RimJ/RimL family protein N-acetyltransferase
MLQPMQTDRLLLRAWRAEDVPGYARMNADPEVTRYLGRGGRTLTLEETRTHVERIEHHWATWGYGLSAVEHLADGHMIGFVGLAHHRWYPDEVEIGWRLDRAYWGRGLATEGAAAVLRHAFEELGLDHVISIADRGNVASRRVMEKNGLRLRTEEIRADEETGEPEPIVVYAISGEEWLAWSGSGR